MFYTFTHTLAVGDVEAAPKKISMPLTAGIIHQVDILFQTGCNHLVRVQIWDDDFQVWPSNRGGTIKGNATAISFRDFYELKRGDKTLTAKIWQSGPTIDVEVIIQIGLLPKSVLQPLSFEELLKAATGAK
ncbi:MAG: hypothetical protein Q8M94_21880 [Ignavibacteria bacterium]|nr:hypothetical protein [Ignavibacteria bacterium]